MLDITRCSDVVHLLHNNTPHQMIEELHAYMQMSPNALLGHWAQGKVILILDLILNIYLC